MLCRLGYSLRRIARGSTKKSEDDEDEDEDGAAVSSAGRSALLLMLPTLPKLAVFIPRPLFDNSSPTPLRAKLTCSVSGGGRLASP